MGLLMALLYIFNLCILRIDFVIDIAYFMLLIDRSGFFMMQADLLR